MDFIERWFELSPDGGDGSLEVLYLFVLVAVVAAIVFRQQMGHWLELKGQSRN